MPGFLFNALQDVRALTRKALVSEQRVRLGGRNLGRVVQQAREARAALLTDIAAGQVLLFRHAGCVVETDLNEPIVGQVWMRHRYSRSCSSSPRSLRMARNK